MPTLDDGIDVRCVILTGAGGMFSAGYDIGDIPDEVFAEEAERLVAHPFSRGDRGRRGASPSRRVAAINGHALGGGLELALRCDLRIAARGAKLGMPPAKLGLIYSHTGLQKFIDAVGVPRTRELFLDRRNIDGRARRADRACQRGHRRRRARGRRGRAGGRDRGQRAAFAEGQQAIDRHPARHPRA